MNELFAPYIAIGAVMLSIFYAAWHEARAKNTRDARLLSAMGVVSLIGSAVASMS